MPWRFPSLLATLAIALTLAAAPAAFADQDSNGPPPLPKNDGPPPLPPVETVEYYVDLNGQSSGPYTKEEVEGLLASGQITSASRAWTEGMDNWAPLSTVEGFAAITPEPTPVPTQMSQDGRTFMAGTWEFQGPQTIPNLGEAVIDLRVTYTADGRVEGYATADVTVAGMPQPVTVTSTAEGTYQARIDGQRIVFTPNITMTTSLPGMPPMTQQDRATEILQIIDRNTIRDSDGVTLTRQGN